MHRSIVAWALALGLCVAGAAPPPPGFGGTDGHGSGAPHTGSGTEASADASGGAVEVTVRASGTTAGGGSFSTVRTRGVAPVCWRQQGWSGRQYFEYRTSDDYQEVLAQMPFQYRSVPYPNFEAHADVDDGFWFEPRCGDGVDFDYLREFLATHPPVFWTPGQVRPDVQDVDPRLLAEVAYDLMELPTGVIRWNPSLDGRGVTVVNTDTWVWVEDGPTAVSVTAEIASGTWARVDAAVSEMTVSAPGADATTCPNTGTAWTPDAEGTSCSIVFTRSSANQPVKAGQDLPTATLQAEATWQATWVSSLDPTPRPLPEQTITTTAQIPVAEIQAIVTVG